MQTPTLWFMLLFVATGLLLAGVSFPLIRRWVKPNHFYGFRIPKTMSSEPIWYEANAYAGRMLLGLSIVYIAASILLYFVFRENFVAYNIACAVVLLGGLLIVVVLSFRYARLL
jgi:uncharacterized membrane protein